MTQTPKPPRLRRDGWTPERWRQFLLVLGETASVTKAVAAVGLSRQSLYQRLGHPGAAELRAAYGVVLADHCRRADALAMAEFQKAAQGRRTRTSVPSSTYRPGTKVELSL